MSNPRDDSTVANVPAQRPPDGQTAAPSRYRPERFHARGGLGEVWAAQDQELHREVALKSVQPRHAGDAESRRRFLLEAEITARLEHPGVVPVYGLQHDADGRPCYAMRFIRGETLQEAIRTFHDADGTGRDPGERSVAFRGLLGRFVAVCNTVAYAHSRGVLHRDLKPANVMLGKYGETLVVDWGLAKPFDRGEEARGSGEESLAPSGDSGDGQTQAGQILGTPAYASPEQAAGRLAELGPASDVYSLGATLYALLTGRPPFEGRTDEVLAAVRVGRFAPPEQVKKDTPRALAAVCRKAMALEPADRYPTALELAAEVERWLADEPVLARREGVAQKLARTCRRRPMLAALLGLFGLADLTLIASLVCAALWADSGIEMMGFIGLFLVGALVLMTALLMQAAALTGWLCGRATFFGRTVFGPRSGPGNWASSGGRTGLVAGFVLGPPLALWWYYHMFFSANLHAIGQSVLWLTATFVASVGAPVLGALLGLLLALRSGPWRPRLAAGAVVGSLVGVFIAPAFFIVAVTKSAVDPDPGRPRFLLYSADQTRMVTPLRDGRVVVWDADSGGAIWEEAVDQKPVLDHVLFSPDGRLLAGITYDGRVRVWDARDGALLATLRERGERVGGLTFSPDGRRLAIAYWAGSLEVWDVETGRRVHSRAIRPGRVSLIAFSPDGRRLATYGPDGMKVTTDFWD
jgi:hypothetical protein